jgi:hypothetical protein
MSFKGRRRGMEVELALKKTTACTTHFSGGSATCANQPCTVQKTDFFRVSSALLQCYYMLQCFSSCYSTQSSIKRSDISAGLDLGGTYLTHLA